MSPVGDRSGAARGHAAIEVREYGDAGLLVDVVATSRDERWAVTQALAAALQADPPPGFVDVVASYEHVFVAFDPLTTEHEAMRSEVYDRLGLDCASTRTPRCFRVPVLYGCAAGPDLSEVAGELGLPAADLVRLHCGAPWTVRFRGSPVAAPFMEGPGMPAPVARRAEPRTTVPPGSVGLSGQQCVVYPVASPGGWRLVGRTPLTLHDSADENLVPYQPGDCFIFVPIAPHQWERWAGRSPTAWPGNAR